MKKILFAALTALALLAGAPAASAQATITTRKGKLADFTQKTTRMVLTGDQIFDGVFQEEIGKRWLVSPFEFITRDQYEACKNDKNFYFLMPVDSRRKKEAEPGLSVLSLLKGGPEEGAAAETGFEILSLPYASAEDPSGREFVFLPALLDIIQNYMKDAMISDASIMNVPGKACTRMVKTGKMKIFIASCDLAEGVKPSASMAEKGISIVDEDDADEALTSGAPDTLVSYVVAPTDPQQKGSISCNMLISADTHEIYFCSRRGVKERSKVGFSAEDIKVMTLGRK